MGKQNKTSSHPPPLREGVGWGWGQLVTDEAGGWGSPGTKASPTSEIRNTVVSDHSEEKYNKKRLAEPKESLPSSLNVFFFPSASQGRLLH